MIKHMKTLILMKEFQIRNWSQTSTAFPIAVLEWVYLVILMIVRGLDNAAQTKVQITQIQQQTNQEAIKEA